MMKAPTLGVLRGRFIQKQKKLLLSLSESLGLEMKIVKLDKIGTDELIKKVVNSGCKSVCFVNIAKISRNFLFLVRFVHEVQAAGISIYVTNNHEPATGFVELDEQEYSDLWDEYKADWDALIEMNAMYLEIHQGKPQK